MSAPESATTVYAMDDAELIAELHTKLTALDEAVAQLFKAHTPIRDEAGTMTPLEHTVSVMRNLETTMDALRSTNPMTLMKQLMGL